MSSLKVFFTFFIGSMSWVAWPCHFCLLVITATATSLLLCQQYQNWYKHLILRFQLHEGELDLFDVEYHMSIIINII